MFSWYPDFEYPLAATQLVLAMVGMGATLTPADFKGVFLKPRGIAFGVILQLLLIPALAYLLGSTLPLSREAMVGLILVAAMPGGAMSNIFTFLGRGNAALSISMTAVSTVLCLGTAPFILQILARDYLPPSFAMPTGKVIFEIAWSLLLPLAIGMGLGLRFEWFRDRVSKWCIRGSILALVVIIVGSLGSGRIQITSYGIWVPVATIALCLGGQLLALALGWVIRLSDGDNLAVGIEVTIRNMNLALLLKASLFPVVVGGDNTLADAVLFIILYYGGTSVSVALFPLIRTRLGYSVLPFFPKIPDRAEP